MHFVFRIVLFQRIYAQKQKPQKQFMPKNFYCEFYCQKNSSLENGLKWSKKARKIKIALDFCLFSFNCW